VNLSLVTARLNLRYKLSSSTFQNVSKTRNNTHFNLRNRKT